MNNIFENAYFGKPYKTRDGSKAIFICQRTDNSLWDLNHPYACVVEGFGEILNYFPNGQLYIGEKFETENDIISEWQPEINEEELDELAYKELGPDCVDDKEEFESCLYTANDYLNAYKLGYRKAKQE